MSKIFLQENIFFFEIGNDTNDASRFNIDFDDRKLLIVEIDIFFRVTIGKY